MVNQIKFKLDLIKNEISEGLYREIKGLTWFNLPFKLNSIFKKLILEKSECISTPYSKFIWFRLNEKVNIICEIIDSILNCTSTQTKGLVIIDMTGS